MVFRSSSTTARRRPTTVFDAARVEYTVLHKTGDTILVVMSLSNLNRFAIFFAGLFPSKFAVKRLLKSDHHTQHMLPHYLVKY